MSDTTIVDATTTTQGSGAEPQTVRRRTYTVRSNRVDHLVVRDLIEFYEAVTTAEAPHETTVYLNFDGSTWVQLVAEWSEDVEVEL